MKKIYAPFLLILCIFSLISCGVKSDGISSNDLSIKYNNTAYKVKDDVSKIKSALGEPTNTIKQYSCHYSENGDEYWFDYYFGNGNYNPDDENFTDVLRIHTVPMKAGTDYICDFECYTSSITTSKGITVGNTLEDIIKAYGEKYTDEGGGYYTYYMGEALPETPKLMFYIPNDKVEFFSISASINF